MTLKLAFPIPRRYRDRPRRLALRQAAADLLLLIPTIYLAYFAAGTFLIDFDSTAKIVFHLGFAFVWIALAIILTALIVAVDKDRTRQYFEKPKVLRNRL